MPDRTAQQVPVAASNGSVCADVERDAAVDHGVDDLFHGRGRHRGAFVHEYERFLNGAARLEANHSDSLAYPRAMVWKFAVAHSQHDRTSTGMDNIAIPLPTEPDPKDVPTAS
jgi:hypothetical protein